MPSLDQILALLMTYKYALMVPLAIVEGPIVSVLCGMLIQLGYVSFWPTYFALMAGDLIGDICWYCVGRFATGPFIRRFGHRFGFTPARMDAVEALYKKHYVKTLLTSKLTMGFGVAIMVLVTAGSIRIPFLSYLLINTLGQFAWSLGMLALGIFFGHYYVTIDEQFRIIYIVGTILTVAVGLYYLQKYVRTRVVKKDL